MSRIARISWIGAAIVLLVVAIGLVFITRESTTVNIYLPPAPDAATSGGAQPPTVTATPPDGKPPPLATKGGSASVPDQPGPAANLDALLDRMSLGAIAFNVPESLNVKQTAVIQLLLSATAALEDLRRELTAPGASMGGRVKISDRMEARLVGSEFDITAIAPETQAVSRQENTEWKWEIKPKRVGLHSLHLTLSALVTIDGETTPRALKTFDRFIVIEITPAQRVAAFVSANWQWLWAAVLVPLATWWWRARRVPPSAS